MTKQIFSAIKVSALAIVLSFGLSFVYAWTAPTQQPPQGNVSAPINTSATDQTKAGDVCTTKGGTTKCLSTASGAIIDTTQFLDKSATGQTKSGWLNASAFYVPEGGQFYSTQASGGFVGRIINGGLYTASSDAYWGTGASVLGGRVYASKEVYSGETMGSNTSLYSNGDVCAYNNGGANKKCLSTAGGGLGVGQTWQNVTASRALGTTYTNTTGRPIEVLISGDTGVTQSIYIYVNGVAIARLYESTNGSGFPASFIVPAGSTYMASYGGIYTFILMWSELR